MNTILQMQCIGQIILSFVRRDSLSFSSHLCFTNKAFEGCTQMLYQHKRAALTHKHCRGGNKKTTKFCLRGDTRMNLSFN